MSLEAGTETCGNTGRKGSGKASKKSNVNNEVEAGSMRGAAHSIGLGIEELCENRRSRLKPDFWKNQSPEVTLLAVGCH